ncbi:MAG: helix-turn-helix domain-containing protein [Spirochaetaceae bacterium]|jgi:putative transcriptional regulator|nr:helix-turn-helix domain-containing protein [Spirochaetaceae bacterium]
MKTNRIVESMKEAVAISKGEMPEDSYHMHIPEKIDVKSIREGMGLSQAAFANRFGLSVFAIRNWEQGKRQPDPAARAYLKVIEKAPQFVASVLLM